MGNNTSSSTRKKANVDAGQSTPAGATGTMPLFFSNPAVLHPNRHAEAGIRVNLPLAFARATNSIPLTVAEFIEVAKFYPIVFTCDDPIVPVALVGLERDNYFVGKDGRWKESTYIPAYVRKYPFVFFELPESKKLTLCIDEDAPQFTAKAKGNDIRLFEKGEPSPFTRNALAFCAAYQGQHDLTRQFCAKLKELGLLVPNRSDANLITGRTISLGGFQVIDQEKLQKLPADMVSELHAHGWLPLMYYTLLSTSSWRNLVDMAAMHEPKN